MPRYARGGIRWIVLPSARAVLDKVRDEFASNEAYLEDRRALQDYLCEYFSDIGCQTSLGNSVSPVGATGLGGKILKVRWNRPGQGKSGALRLIVVAYCDDLEVRIALANLRAKPASDEDVADATKDL